MNYRKLLGVGDCHFPYSSDSAVRDLLRYIKAEKPDMIVQVGDLYDQYAFSRYGKSLNKDTPNAEMERGKRKAAEMWREIVATGATCIQLRGNHDVRLAKRIAEKLPEATDFFDDSRLFDFPKVQVAKNDRDPMPIRLCGEKVLLHHGFLSKTGDHVKYFRENVILGHTHRGHTHFERMGKRVLWELNCGFMGDEKSHVFGYGAAPHRWTLGWGVVDENGPRFIGL
jgi:predicted phosphodiesterase